MLPAAQDVKRRRPVWEALADLFLDSFLDEGTRLDFIARTLAASDYTVKELDRILVEEVAPVLYYNVYDVAGGWLLFPVELLAENILRNRGCRYWLERLIVMRPALWTIWRDWKKVKASVVAMRG